MILLDGNQAMRRGDLSEAELQSLLLLNELRHDTDREPQRLAELEAEFETSFKVSSHLAVYGTLAPGRVNHHLVADIPGEWISDLFVRGHLMSEGWGASLGFPALRWTLDGPEVAIQLFISTQLSEHWPRLDEFEGEEYQRILVPVYRGHELMTIANLYALKADD